MNQGSKTRQQLLLKTSEQNLEERLRFETLLSDISARFMASPLDQVDSEIHNALRRIKEGFGLFGQLGISDGNPNRRRSRQ